MAGGSGPFRGSRILDEREYPLASPHIAAMANLRRMADSPLSISLRAWFDVLRRTWTEAGADNIGLIAAGTAFYAFAAIVPLLASVVLIYGLVADPATVVANIRSLFGVLPDDAARLIGDQLTTVVGTSEGKKGFGLVAALGLSLYGGTKGASATVTALNIAYEERETRGFVARTLLSFAITGAAVLIAIAAALSTAGFALLDSLMPAAPAIVLTATRFAGYAVLAALGVTGASCLYRFGPNRAAAKWRWLTPGSVAATAIWLLATIGFGIYVSKFGNYGATYGSLSAVVVLLTWLWLSAYVFLLGAELNSELEQQAMRGTMIDARPVDHAAVDPAPTAIHPNVGSSAPPIAAKQAKDADFAALERHHGEMAASPPVSGGLRARYGVAKKSAPVLLFAAAAFAWHRRAARNATLKRNGVLHRGGTAA